MPTMGFRKVGRCSTPIGGDEATHKVLSLDGVALSSDTRSVKEATGPTRDEASVRAKASEAGAADAQINEQEDGA